MLRFEFLVLGCFFFFACTGGSDDPATLNVCPVPPSRVLHEHQLATDNTIHLQIADAMVLELESGVATSVHPSDSGDKGEDVVSYVIPVATTMEFTRGSSSFGALYLETGDGERLATLNNALDFVRITVPQGTLVLRIEGHATESKILHLLPTNCAQGIAIPAAITTAYPGVYINELPSMGGADVPPSTNVTAFVGTAGAGLLNTATLITNFDDYMSLFVNGDASGHMDLAVEQFFLNGGNVAYVVRVAGDEAGDAPAMNTLVDGLDELDTISGINILVVPDLVRMTAADAASMIAAMGDYAGSHAMLALASTPVSLTTVSSVNTWVDDYTDQFSSRYVALYTPSMTFSEGGLVTGATGAIAGIMATSDIAVGVWAAPAGVHYPINTAFSLGFTVNDTEQGELSANRVNVIKNISLYGTVIWGAKTLSHTPLWQYLSSVRLGLFIDASIKSNLQWVVFASNTPQLWAAMTRTATNILSTLWESGGLFGASAAQAFNVICNVSNNPPETQIQGKVFLDIAYAPERPADFVVGRYEFTSQ